MYKNFVISEITKSHGIIASILDNSNFIDTAVQIGQVCAEAIQKGNKVIFAGNGGSAADSQHLAAEFVSKLSYNRPAMASVAITTDTSALTAIGNDYGFENLFSRQIEAIGKKGDVFIGISTSGNSKNIINAFKVAKKNSIYTIGFTGSKECEMDKICDLLLKSPSHITPKIQETHIMMGHIICAVAEDIIFGKEYNPNKK